MGGESQLIIHGELFDGPRRRFYGSLAIRRTSTPGSIFPLTGVGSGNRVRGQYKYARRSGNAWQADTTDQGRQLREDR
jgi:hypothetical protein